MFYDLQSFELYKHMIYDCHSDMWHIDSDTNKYDLVCIDNYSLPAEIHTTNIILMFAIHPRKIGVMFTNLAIVGGCTLLLLSA